LPVEKFSPFPIESLKFMSFSSRQELDLFKVFRSFRMGPGLSVLPLQTPMCFSYYGPIRHAEASEALDAAITSHLQEIGSPSRIPIRKEAAEELIVPVGLNSPAFTESDGSPVVHFAASSPGRLVVRSGSDLENVFVFREGLYLTAAFRRADATALRFEFDAKSGVSARTFILSMRGKAMPTIIDDRIVVDGQESSIARVFLGQEAGPDGAGDFSDGLCLICCGERAAVIAYPCRHCSMCRGCSERFAGLSNRCPVCRATVVELIDCRTVDRTW
jgi:hypothetical protein